MKNYFLVKIKYEKTSDDGKIVKVSEQYLLDAMSWTEAEARIIEEMIPFISGEFEVAAISKARINELFPNENGDKWYKSKINFVSLDEEKGVEKRTPVYVMVQANDTKEANANIIEGFKGSMADYEIVSVTETKILDVFQY